ncbi:MAG: 4Fe-4S binding protein [Bacteroidales bacterium]|nr:4Fe-4S binding protein [Bacteroidales bacterium]
MSKKNCSNWPKHLLQWGTLAAIVFFLSGLAAKIFTKLPPSDPETYCPAGGLQAFVTYLVRGSLPCSMSSLQILMGIALAAAVILFSKLFCAYLCPVGTVEDLLIKLRKGLKIKSVAIRRGSVLDAVLRLVKYVLLFWIFYMTATSSELFCKNLDPYYAVATGFKGEITLWMSIVTVSLVLLCGLFIDRFWCKYICPLGAASNTLKFWVPVGCTVLIYWGLQLLGVHINWFWLLGAICLVGYLCEVVFGRSRMQLLYVVKNETACTHCGLCNKACPMAINIDKEGARVTDVDCILCGDCVSACNSGALGVGVKKSCKAGRFIPAILTVVFFVCALVIGNRFELPTIDVSWDLDENVKYETVKVENLKSVHCYGSSMAFKARMEKVRGVHGVKTYVGSHSVVIKFDPAVTTAEKIQEAVFVPSTFRVESLSPDKYSELKYMTIRTEKMYDRMDLNYLGLQFRLTDKEIYGLESEYDCPLIIRVYMAPQETADEKWFREVVDKKVLAMPLHGGGVKETPVDFEFVRLEKEIGHIGIAEYLEKMFNGFNAEYNGRYPSGDTTVVRKRVEVYKDKPQFIYEIVEEGFEKPILMRYMPYLSNHLSKEEGVIATYVKLNADLLPCLQVRFAAPMTAERVRELIDADKWIITYATGEVKEESAKFKLDAPGTCYKYEQ